MGAWKLLKPSLMSRKRVDSGLEGADVMCEGESGVINLGSEPH